MAFTANWPANDDSLQNDIKRTCLDDRMTQNTYGFLNNFYPQRSHYDLKKLQNKNDVTPPEWFNMITNTSGTPNNNCTIPCKFSEDFVDAPKSADESDEYVKFRVLDTEKDNFLGEKGKQWVLDEDKMNDDDPDSLKRLTYYKMKDIPDTLYTGPSGEDGAENPPGEVKYCYNKETKVDHSADVLKYIQELFNGDIEKAKTHYIALCQNAELPDPDNPTTGLRGCPEYMRWEVK